MEKYPERRSVENQSKTGHRAGFFVYGAPVVVAPGAGMHLPIRASACAGALFFILRARVGLTRD